MAGSQKTGSSKDGSPPSKATTKQLAAQARAEAEAAERRRERLVRIIGGVVVLVVVVALITVGFLAGRGDSNDTAAAPTPDASAPRPTDVSAETYGWQYGTGWTAANEAKLPTLELWEDFQCPACKALENAVGPQIADLGASGTVKLLYRPTTFLDRNSNLQIPNSSARATAAWGCAIDAGKGMEYHSTIFANQPTEGDGYADETLMDFAGKSGITGDAMTTFTSCFQDGKYLPWSANSYQKFQDGNVGGTPTGYLNGVELSASDLADIEGLKQKIAAATAK